MPYTEKTLRITKKKSIYFFAYLVVPSCLLCNTKLFLTKISLDAEIVLIVQVVDFNQFHIRRFENLFGTALTIISQLKRKGIVRWKIIKRNHAQMHLFDDGIHLYYKPTLFWAWDSIVKLMIKGIWKRSLSLMGFYIELQSYNSMFNVKRFKGGEVWKF